MTHAPAIAPHATSSPSVGKSRWLELVGHYGYRIDERKMLRSLIRWHQRALEQGISGRQRNGRDAPVGPDDLEAFVEMFRAGASDARRAPQVGAVETWISAGKLGACAVPA